MRRCSVHPQVQRGLAVEHAALLRLREDTEAGAVAAHHERARREAVRVAVLPDVGRDIEEHDVRVELRVELDAAALLLAEEDVHRLAQHAERAAPRDGAARCLLRAVHVRDDDHVGARGDRHVGRQRLRYLAAHVVPIADAERPEHARHALRGRDGAADRDALLVARTEHNALRRVDVDGRDEHLLRELGEVVDGERALDVPLQLLERERPGEKVFRIEEIARAREPEERRHVHARPGVAASPRQTVRVEEHVERDVLPVRRAHERARPRADVDLRVDPELFTGLEDAEVREAARRSTGGHECDLEA